MILFHLIFKLVYYFLCYYWSSKITIDCAHLLTFYMVFSFHSSRILFVLMSASKSYETISTAGVDRKMFLFFLRCSIDVFCDNMSYRLSCFVLFLKRFLSRYLNMR